MDLFTKLFGNLLAFVYHCFDRIVIHGYLSALSRPEQVVHFVRKIVGVPVVSKEILSQRTADYQNWVEAYARNHHTPIDWAEKGVRKEDHVRPWLRRMANKNATASISSSRAWSRGRASASACRNIQPARVATARAQVAMRERVRNDQSAGRGENRRNAEDDVASAEAAVVEARAAFDAAALAKRAGSGSDAAMATARAGWTRAQENLDRQRARLRKLESEFGTPLPTQKEGDLEVARSELQLSVAQLEKLTIRAPIAGTVLQVNVKVGEVAGPTASQPLILLGDLSRLRVRAEVDEHDVGKIAPGGEVVVRADAFRGREFTGKVASIAPIVRLGRISSPESGHLTDFSVNEVLVQLDNPGPLLVGLKVDVYFRPPTNSAQNAAKGTQ